MISICICIYILCIIWFNIFECYIIWFISGMLNFWAGGGGLAALFYPQVCWILFRPSAETTQNTRNVGWSQRGHRLGFQQREQEKFLDEDWMTKDSPWNPSDSSRDSFRIPWLEVTNNLWKSHVFHHTKKVTSRISQILILSFLFSFINSVFRLNNDDTNRLQSVYTS